MEYTQQPAFPPQVAQDNLGRLIAPIPGMSKLEFAALMLLPTFIHLKRNTDGILVDGKRVGPIEASIACAQKLFETVNKTNNENNNSNLELV